MPVHDVLIPNDMDVLCGRGSTCYKHPGNQHFRVVIAVHLPKYANPDTSRKEKTSLIQKIVNDLQYKENSRFLREGEGGWYCLNINEAKAKVGHAMRDAAAEMKRCLKRKHVRGLKIIADEVQSTKTKSLDSRQEQPMSMPSLCISGADDIDDSLSDSSISDNEEEHNFDFSDCFDFIDIHPTPKKSLLIENSLALPVASTPPDLNQLIRIINQSA
mmetsp:Transcript_10702/g.16398  ORF Transcript_10702/g.16398 Transcript_10702/m.16398 type:complete len:216 (-) Transcript_10702:87-734(-)